MSRAEKPPPQQPLLSYTIFGFDRTQPNQRRLKLRPLLFFHRSTLQLLGIVRLRLRLRCRLPSPVQRNLLRVRAIHSLPSKLCWSSTNGLDWPVSIVTGPRKYTNYRGGNKKSFSRLLFPCLDCGNKSGPSIK